MYCSDAWQDYRLVDCGRGERLERWGEYTLVRPDPQAIWDTPRTNPLWENADGIYRRSDTGGGSWIRRSVPATWKVRYGKSAFWVKPMNFKHTGIFPEQAVNWDFCSDKIRTSKRDIRVLNLFAYTGAATVACAEAGAFVCHVDAAGGMVQMAKENARLNTLPADRVRWIVDDCVKFVKREIRRGQSYDAIIMDPPSYGRGPGGEKWKLEDSLWDFLNLALKLLSPDPLFVLVNSYTTGLSPAVLSDLLQLTAVNSLGGSVESEELGLPIDEKNLYLPCGVTARWTPERKEKPLG